MPEFVIRLERYFDPVSNRRVWLALCTCGWAGPNRRGIVRGWWRAVADGTAHRTHFVDGAPASG